MSLKRSAWSGFVLSCAVSAVCALSSARGQDAPTAPAESAPALPTGETAGGVKATGDTVGAGVTVPPVDTTPGGDANSEMAEDFLHYMRVHSVEMANATGQKLLDLKLEPRKFLEAFEVAAKAMQLGNGAADFRSIVEGASHRDDTKEVATKVLTAIDEGYRASVRSRDRIMTELERLNKGVRGYHTARERLTAAGQYAVPIMIDVLHNEGKKELHPDVLRVMVDIGRPLLPPLLEQLNMSEQANKTSLIRVVGEMGYPQSLPVLIKMVNDPKQSQEVKDAANAAILQINHGKAVTEGAGELFLKVAQAVFMKAPGNTPPNADEAMNVIWVYHADVDNVEGTPVPTAIWSDILTQRCAKQCLLLQPGNSTAISLWIAAGFKRELDLPQGTTDTMKTEMKVTPEMIASSGGATYLNPVLSLALERGDSPLILKTLSALDATAGIVELVPRAQMASTAGATGAASDAGKPMETPPIVRCLAYPDRVVRFKAAEILAKINPSDRFTGYFRVVPVLAEAISQTGTASILLINDNTDHRLRLKDALRNSQTGYTVYDGSSLLAALENAKKAAAFDAIVIVNGPDVSKIREMGRTDYRLMNPPVVIMAPLDQQALVKSQIVGVRGVGVLPIETADEPPVTAAIATARGQQATPIDQTMATGFATMAIAAVGSLAQDHGSIYNVEDARTALTDALRDKRPEIAIASAVVLSKFNNVEAQRSLAAAGLSNDIADASIRSSMFIGIAESARRLGNALDAGQIDKIIRVISSDLDPSIRSAAAEALGALNVPSNQASELIRTQTPDLMDKK